jgi:hypothetical protein
MDKSNQIGSQSSAVNMKSNNNPHLLDEQLLLALDGELSAREAAEVESHLKACWSCRARREHIEKAIGDVVEYRDHLIQPYFPIPRGGRSLFVARLEQLAISIGPHPVWKRVLRAFGVFGALPRTVEPRYVWLSLLIAVGLAFFSFQGLWKVRKVSASELLENAQGSEVHALQSVAKPVVYQKLSFGVDGQTVTRTSYRDPVGNRHADHIDASEGAAHKLADSAKASRQPKDQTNAAQTAVAELRRAFLTAQLSWEDPLSPTNYRTWYKGLTEKLDEVTTTGDDFITLKTTTSEGPIAEASITVRATDFHPVAEDLLLRDSRDVKVQELAWEVLPMEAINVAIFEPEPTVYTVIRHPESVPLQPPGPTEPELGEAELQARVAIHSEKADLGEQIELDREISKSGQMSVVVQGTVSTQERQNDLFAALQGIPHVEVRLQTMEDAQSQQDQFRAVNGQGAVPQIAQEAAAPEYGVASDGVESTKQPPAIAVAGRRAFEERLEERFPIAEDRIAFVNETVELVQDAMAQAWALRRLSNRYTPEMVAELSSGSQQTLELLVRDHVSVLRQEVDEARVRLSPPFKKAVPSPGPAPALATAGMASDWRGTVMMVFPETQKVNDYAGALLAGPDETLSDLQVVDNELQQALAELGTHLTALYRQVGGPFLSELKNGDK